MTSKKHLRFDFGCHFFQIKAYQAILQRLSHHFAQIFTKSKFLGVRLHPHLLHQCRGVTLDRSLLNCQHLESLRKKLTSYVALLGQLAGSSWGSGETTLQITTIALVH